MCAVGVRVLNRVRDYSGISLRAMGGKREDVLTGKKSFSERSLLEVEK